MANRAGVAGLLVGVVAVVVSPALGDSAAAGLPSPPFAVSSPAYSLDGTQVSYAIHQAPGLRGWVVVGAATDGGVRPVYSSTDSCCTGIAWASATRIVFVDDYQLKSVDLKTRKVTALFSGAPTFLLSSNRQTIAIADGCECGHSPDAVALLDVDGRDPRVIPKPKAATDELDDFSPDGTQLVFTRYPYVYDNTSVNKPSLFAVSVRGGTPVPLRRSGITGTAHLPANADDVTWSSNGRWLSYFTPEGLWLLNTATERARLAASAHGPGAAEPGQGAAWSPTFPTLVYNGLYPSGKRTKAGPILIARLTLINTSGARMELWNGPLTDETDNRGERPQWAPDGKSLTFVAGPAVGPFTYPKVYVVRTNGRGLHPIS